MRYLPLTTLSALFLVLITGCKNSTPPAAIDMSKPPPRPAQLDRLAPFIGQWEYTMEMKDPSGKVSTGKGSSTFTWEAEKWLAVERVSGTMPEGGPMSGISVWSYDPKAGNYPVFWSDNWGNMSHGVATYDEATKSWTMHSMSQNPHMGMKMKDEGTMRAVDANTIEWSGSSTVDGQKVMEMKGTSKRKQ